jgi:pre-mRNA-processing factor 17
MNVNLTYEEMSRPVAGPEDPFNQRKNKGMNSLAGHVEEQAMDDYTFAMQQRTFDVHGYALNPSAENAGAKPIVGSLNSAHDNGYMTIDAMRPSKATKRETKRKRDAKGDATIVDGEGAYMGPWASWEQDKQEVVEMEEEESDEWREEKRRREEAKEAAKAKMEAAREEKSIFHGAACLAWVKPADASRQGVARLCRSNVHAHPH